MRKDVFKFFCNHKRKRHQDFYGQMLDYLYNRRFLRSSFKEFELYFYVNGTAGTKIFPFSYADRLKAYYFFQMLLKEIPANEKFFLKKMEKQDFLYYKRGFQE